jgi:hypothetical protein
MTKTGRLATTMLSDGGPRAPETSRLVGDTSRRGIEIEIEIETFVDLRENGFEAVGSRSHKPTASPHMPPSGGEPRNPVAQLRGHSR